MKENDTSGYFGIGIYQGKTAENIGTLWRTADLMGASFVFTIGRRYKVQASDTMKTTKHIPLYHYETFFEFYKHMPIGAKLIGIETLTVTPIKQFIHPKQAIYLLGSEDNGLPEYVIEKCHEVVILPGRRSMNVAVAGSIVMFDRVNKF